MQKALITSSVTREIRAGVADECVNRTELALGDFDDLRCRCGFGDASVNQRELI